MWFFPLSILLSTTSILHGSEDSQLAIKELHYEISKVAREVHELYVEPDTAQKELDDKMNKALEEYIGVDISSGLPEQIELLDLKDKAEDVKTSEETRKAVVDGLDYLRNVKEMSNDVLSLPDDISSELKELRKRKQTDINSILDFALLENTHYRLMLNTMQITDYADMAIKRSSDSYIRGILRKFILEFMTEFHSYRHEINKIKETTPLPSSFIEYFSNQIAEGKKKANEIKKLNEEFDFSKNIQSLEKEMKMMEAFRDSETIQRNLKTMETVAATFESIKEFNGIDGFQWKIVYLMKKWITVQTHLKNLKIGPGNLSEPFAKIGSCLQNEYFSLEFSSDEENHANIKKMMDKIRDKENAFNRFMNTVKEYQRAAALASDLLEWSRVYQSSSKELEKLKKNFYDVAQENKIPLPDDLKNALLGIQELLNYDDIKTLVDEVSSKIKKIKEFLNCYSSLKIVPSQVKSLMDQPKEVWNFDARPLESVVEVVYLFKEAHRFLDKKEYPIPIDGFPLTKEEVTGISDGLGILKAILDFQKLWTEIPQNFSSSSLGEEFSNLEIRLDLSNILFPSDIDSTISFYSTQYQGPQQRRILKILESVKDYSQFPSKPEKMSEAVGKWKNWKKQQNPEEETVDGELIDCFEGTCNQPISFPEESAKRVEL